MSSPLVSLDELMEQLASYGLDKSKLVRSAIKTARRNYPPLRYSNNPFMSEHIFPITSQVMFYAFLIGKEVSEEIVAASILHDILESSPIGDKEFEEMFGSRVYRLVKAVSRPYFSELPKDIIISRESRNREYQKRLKDATVESKLIKVIDRLNNMLCLDVEPEQKARLIKTYVEESEFYLQLSSEVSPYIRQLMRRKVEELKILRI